MKFKITNISSFRLETYVEFDTFDEVINYTNELQDPHLNENSVRSDELGIQEIFDEE